MQAGCRGSRSFNIGCFHSWKRKCSNWEKAIDVWHKIWYIYGLPTCVGCCSIHQISTWRMESFNDQISINDNRYSKTKPFSILLMYHRHLRLKTCICRLDTDTKPNTCGYSKSLLFSEISLVFMSVLHKQEKKSGSMKHWHIDANNYLRKSNYWMKPYVSVTSSIWSVGAA